MDAHALLSAQGWRGTGHSLHKTDDAIGLAKPLLLSRKDNTKGLGQKQHFTSDQWWMNAFDEQLKGLDTSKKGVVVQTVTSGKLNSLDKNLGKYSVYTSFVRGGFLQGTIELLKIKDSSTSADSTESSSDDSAAPKPKTTGSESKTETKEERRARREGKRKRKEQRALNRAARQERRKLRKERKESKSSAQSSDADNEKRRRRARKEEKRRQRKNASEK